MVISGIRIGRGTAGFLSLSCLLLGIGTVCSFSIDGKPEARGELVVMSYNIHHALGSDGVIDLQRIADVILSADPDLVALQEVDRFVERSQRVDQAERLAQLTGMEMRFGFAIPYQGGDFGNVVLSRHPIRSSATYPLPGDPGEARVLLEVLIDWPDEDGHLHPVSLFDTHLDPIREPREAAVALILKAIPAASDTFRILAGDFNDIPDSPSIRTLSAAFVTATPSPLFTYPADRPNRQLDYIFHTASPSWELIEARTIDVPIASDHAPIVAAYQPVSTD